MGGVNSTLDTQNRKRNRKSMCPVGLEVQGKREEKGSDVGPIIKKNKGVQRRAGICGSIEEAHGKEFHIPSSSKPWGWTCPPGGVG